MRRADRAADRIQTGIDLLSEPDMLEALRIVIRGANLVIASPRSGAAGEVAT